MSDQDKIETAARLLWRAWQRHETLDTLPDGLHPRTLAEGYAVQDAVGRLNDLPVRGWKIGVTNEAARRLLGIPDPVAGRLYAPFCRASPGSFGADEFAMRALEPEIAFTIAEDVKARCTEVPIASAHPALEIPDTRWKDWTRIGAPGFVADNSAAGRFVLGPARDWPGRVPARLVINGKVAAEGGSEQVMGDPLNALVWLANHLLERGLYLKRGDVVTTGTCTPIKQAERGDHVAAEFEGFGRVEARFT